MIFSIIVACVLFVLAVVIFYLDNEREFLFLIFSFVLGFVVWLPIGFIIPNVVSDRVLDSKEFTREYKLLSEVDHKIVYEKGSPKETEYSLNSNLGESQYIFSSKKIENGFFTFEKYEEKRDVELSIKDLINKVE